eukprot:COSAG04_NODE_7672_length_1089_cov_1.615152_2_plen_115_part_01
MPYIFDGVSNGGQGQIASTRVGLETPVGTVLDMAIARAAYRDEFWMQQMRMRNASGFVNFPMPSPNHPHCYQITALLAIFDQFRAFGNTTWLEAAQGGWEILTESFVQIDGSSAL